jgi:hypothetical protein
MTEEKAKTRLLPPDQVRGRNDKESKGSHSTSPRKGGAMANKSLKKEYRLQKSKRTQKKKRKKKTKNKKALRKEGLKNNKLNDACIT